MENITRYPLIEELIEKARAQVAAVQGLASQMESEAKRMRRQDQAAILNLKAISIAKEVKRARGMEEEAANHFTAGRLTHGLIGFGVGILAGAISGSGHPLRAGARLASNYLSKTAPFGTVLVGIAMGPKCTLEDQIKVIELSQMARESGTTEAQVTATLQSQGLVLVTPEEFAERMDEMVRNILDGKPDLSRNNNLSEPAAAGHMKLVTTGDASQITSQGSPRIT